MTLIETAAKNAEELPDNRNRSHDPALDGVRGIAVLLVLAFHFIVFWARPGAHGLEGMIFAVSRFGEYGVTIFFVLSGFLITRILLRARGADGYFRSFYGRRLVRIFPLYYITLTTILFILPTFHTSSFVIFRGYQIWLWTYAVNIAPFFIRINWGYLNPFWTLALEEQFYLIWPAIVWLCPPRRLATICYGGLVSLVLIRLATYLYNPHGLAVFELAGFQADGLLAGALLALRFEQDKPPNKRFVVIVLLLSIVGLGAIFPAMTRSAPFTLIVKFSLITGIVSALFTTVIFNYFGGFSRKIATVMPLRFFGKYSYALYMFHYPLLPYLAQNFPASAISQRLGYVPSVVIFALWATFVTLVLAVLSWNLIEKHFLRLKVYFPTVTQPDRLPVSE